MGYSWKRLDIIQAGSVKGHCVNMNVSGWINARVNIAVDFLAYRFSSVSNQKAEASLEEDWSGTHAHDWLAVSLSLFRPLYTRLLTSK